MGQNIYHNPSVKTCACISLVNNSRSHFEQASLSVECGSRYYKLFFFNLTSDHCQKVKNPYASQIYVKITYLDLILRVKVLHEKLSACCERDTLQYGLLPQN